MIWVLVVKHFEDAHPYPVVEHRFRGKTRKEAEHFYESHLASDRFMRDCVKKTVGPGLREGMFDGRVHCRSVLSWERE
jgi:hypothetical protein